MADFTVVVNNLSKEQHLQGIRHAVGNENERRTALVPPGDPLPVSPNSALKTSYEELSGDRLLKILLQDVLGAAGVKAKSLNLEARGKISTDAQLEAAADVLEPLPTPP